VKGLLVAEEPNFLFSNIVTAINAPLRRALNRERTNVGRTAYSDRVKEILKESRSPAVAGPLAADLGRFVSGLQSGISTVHYAREDGYRIIVVPDDIAHALGRLVDLAGNPMFDIGRFHQEWNDSHTYTFVDPDALSAAAARYCGTFLQELTHAVSGLPDLTFEIEDALTTQMGTVARSALTDPRSPRPA